MSTIHPPPIEFSPEEIQHDHVLRYFHYTHLPPHLRVVSAVFCAAAREILTLTPRNPERTVALRKLLEAKDCAVRALIEGEVS